MRKLWFTHTHTDLLFRARWTAAPRGTHLITDERSVLTLVTIYLVYLGILTRHLVSEVDKPDSFQPQQVQRAFNVQGTHLREKNRRANHQCVQED